jgi:AraC family transcriptional regulator, regulatory protein of adaptative response / DNA-3-methyladenine glycosylase II
VRRFVVAAAAEAAGFRACLRCRPYRAGGLVSWTGPELVCRAVQLILAGELDRGGEADLGRRLGVSARHLRRLFGAHLGVTPDGLARSARAHFARRLLDDTDLSVTEVAFAAGFGSLRQFNRVCREVFRGSPGELRARRWARDRLVADGGLLLRLPFAGPLDWAALARYLGARAIPGVESVCGASYRRTVVVGGDPGVLELFPGGDEQLLLRAHLPHWAELIHIVERARRIASLDLDLDEPSRRLGGCATIGPLVRALPGHARRRPPRPARPPPGHADAIRSFAAAVRDDQIRLDRSITLERLIDSITTIDGLAPTTAHYLALRLGEPDAYPAADPTPHPRPSRAAPATDAYPENWRPWRALATTHLWAADPTNQPALAA